MLPDMMREADVRQALYESEIRRILANDPQGMVIDELGVMEGKYRIDVAVIGEQLHGYGKSKASDNLERLPAPGGAIARFSIA